MNFNNLIEMVSTTKNISFSIKYDQNFINDVNWYYSNTNTEKTQIDEYMNLMEHLFILTVKTFNKKELISNLLEINSKIRNLTFNSCILTCKRLKRSIYYAKTLEIELALVDDLQLVE